MIHNFLVMSANVLILQSKKLLFTLSIRPMRWGYSWARLRPKSFARNITSKSCLTQLNSLSRKLLRIIHRDVCSKLSIMTSTAFSSNQKKFLIWRRTKSYKAKLYEKIEIMKRTHTGIMQGFSSRSMGWSFRMTYRYSTKALSGTGILTPKISLEISLSIAT